MQDENVSSRAAEVDSVYVFNSGRGHHVTRVMVTRFPDRPRGET